MDSNACQCCRTVLFVDKQQRLHITYRDIEGDNIRDMAHVVSADGGQTFTKPQSVYADHWNIAACPHTGPSMAQTEDDLFVAWFSGTSASHEAGLRLTKIGQKELFFSHLTVRAKHPQIADIHEKLVVVWDESMEKEGKFFSKIGICIFDKTGKRTIQYLTPDFDSATYPVIVATPKGILLAYEIQREKNKTVLIQTNLFTVEAMLR